MVGQARRRSSATPNARRLAYLDRQCHAVRMEIVFSVTQESDGGFCAECLSDDIFTQGDTWEDLRLNVQEAVAAYYFDRDKPSTIRLHLVRDEVLACA